MSYFYMLDKKTKNRCVCTLIAEGKAKKIINASYDDPEYWLRRAQRNAKRFGLPSRLLTIKGPIYVHYAKEGTNGKEKEKETKTEKI